MAKRSPVKVLTMSRKKCNCGCGKLAPVANRNRAERGVLKGQVRPYIRGHEPIASRFWPHVNRYGPVHPVLKTRCWLWMGYRNADGYGKLGSRVAHRVAWFIATGKWPEPCALHGCDNRPCVRFSHLHEGTKGDNNRERTAKGRQAQGETVHSARLTKADVLSIRAILNCGASITALAKEYGMSKSAIHDIKTRRKWKHV